MSVIQEIKTVVETCLCFQETPSGRKKKIIPVSDFESSPSPESPRSPRDDHGFPVEDKAEVIGDEMDKKRKSIGLKLKSSYSESGLRYPFVRRWLFGGGSDSVRKLQRHQSTILIVLSFGFRAV